MTFGKKRGVSRFDSYDFNGWFLGFQILADAGKRAACADTSEENINSAVCIVVDFRACCFFMYQRIDRVGKLAGNKRIRNFFSQFICFVNSAFHACFTRSKNDFSTISRNKIAAFNGHGFRHREDSPVAFCSCNGGQANARIAAGRFNNDRTFFENTFLFCIFNHGFCNTVFGRTGRIECIQFD